MFAFRNVFKGNYDDRDAFIEEAMLDMGHADSIEVGDQTPPPPTSNVQIVQLDDDDDVNSESNAAVAADAAVKHADMVARIQLHVEKRENYETHAIACLPSTEMRDMNLDHTLESAKRIIRDEQKQRTPLTLSTTASSSIFESKTLSGQKPSTTVSIMDLAASSHVHLTSVKPDAWVLPATDGEYEADTQRHFHARTQRGASIFAAGMPARDAALDAQPAGGLPEDYPIAAIADIVPDDRGGIMRGATELGESKEPACCAVCIYCSSDLRKSADYRIKLRVGRDLLEYFPKHKVLNILNVFCDECVIHYLDAIITADWDDVDTDSVLKTLVSVIRDLE